MHHLDTLYVVQSQRHRNTVIAGPVYEIVRMAGNQIHSHVTSIPIVTTVIRRAACLGRLLL